MAATRKSRAYEQGAILLAKFAVVAAIIWLIARSLDIGAAIANLRSLSPLVVVAVLALFFVQQAIAALRLRYVLPMFGQKLPFGATLCITMVGNFFGQTFVSFLGGDASRFWEMRQRGIPLRDAGKAVLLDRLLGLIGAHLLIVGLLPWTLGAIDDEAMRGGLVLVVVGGLAAIIAVCAAGFLRGAGGWLPVGLREHALFGLMLDLATVARVMFAHLRLAALSLLTSLAIGAINVVIVYVFLADLGAPVTLFGCFLVVPVVMELAMLPVSIAGWGVREGLMVAAFATLGIAGEDALGASILFGLTGLAFSLTGGTLWLATRRGAGGRRTADIGRGGTGS